MLTKRRPLFLISTEFLKGSGSAKQVENIMRADPIRNVDIGIIKNTQVAQTYEPNFGSTVLIGWKF